MPPSVGYKGGEELVEAGTAATMTVRVLDDNGDKIARYTEADHGFPVELNVLRALREKHPDARYIDVEFPRSS